MSEAGYLDRLSQKKSMVVVAPAGYGKTELIVDTILRSEGKHLILTHTNAGVSSLRKRLESKGVKSSLYKLETIASWSLFHITAFPKISDYKMTVQEDVDWKQVYVSFAKFMQLDVFRECLLRTYTDIFVDEYQDCSIAQHQIVLALSKIIPCKIFGDPMQGIYDFNEPIVDWDRDVLSNFEVIKPLKTPWRWIKSGQPELGLWLEKTRFKLERNEPIDISKTPKSVIWKKFDFKDFYNTYKYGYLGIPESVMIITKWRRGDANKWAQMLGGRYKLIEEMATSDLFDFTKELENSMGLNRCRVFLDIISTCFAGSHLEINKVGGLLDAEKKEGLRKNKLGCFILALSDANDTKTIVRILSNVERYLDRKKIYRLELWKEIINAIKSTSDPNFISLTQNAKSHRERLRKTGRFIYLRSVATTLLIKGLEFDHVAIINPSFNNKNLYVALTRAKKTITIWSNSPIIKPLD